MNKNKLIGKRLTSMLAISVMVFSSLMVITYGASTSQAEIQSPYGTHYDWNGYNGNSTLYMSEGLTTARQLPNIHSNAAIKDSLVNAQYYGHDSLDPSTNNVNMTNSVIVSTGNFPTEYGDLQFSESFSNGSNGNVPELQILIPVSTISSSVTLNESNAVYEYLGDQRTFENLSAWGVNTSSSFDNVKINNLGERTNYIVTSYDNEMNTSGLSYVTKLVSTNSFNF